MTTIDKIEKEVLEEIERNNELLLGAFTPEEKCIINAILHECIKLTTKKTAQEIFSEIEKYLIGHDYDTKIPDVWRYLEHLKQKWGVK